MTALMTRIPKILKECNSFSELMALSYEEKQVLIACLKELQVKLKNNAPYLDSIIEPIISCLLEVRGFRLLGLTPEQHEIEDKKDADYAWQAVLAIRQTITRFKKLLWD